MLSSLYSGISGLLSNSDALDVISNNISNVNTVGYKSQTAQFEDVLYQTIVGASGTSQVGRGSALESVRHGLLPGLLPDDEFLHRPRHRRAGVLHRAKVGGPDRLLHEGRQFFPRHERRPDRQRRRLRPGEER